MPLRIVERITNQKKLIILWSSISCLIGMVLWMGEKIWSPQQFLQLKVQLLFPIVSVIFLICFGLIVTIAILHGEYNKFKGFYFDPINGCWTQKNKDIWLCAACKVDNKYSPLKIIDLSTSDMICPKCGERAKNLKLELFRLLREEKISIDDLKT